MNLADNIKRIRKDNNLSQEQLAEKLGVSRQSVSKWESGTSYPEMDKVLQICQLFNLNINELINENIKEIAEVKEADTRTNKYITSFFDCITKLVDMCSSMKWKEKIKCIIEQFFVGFILFIIFFIIGCIFSNLFTALFDVLPYGIYRGIHDLCYALYVIIACVIGFIILFHIFKIRYLDYYEVVKDDIEISNEQVELVTEVSAVEDNENKYNKSKIVLEKKKEKVIIRDPKHSEYKFFTGLGKLILYSIKVMTGFILLGFACTMICLVMCVPLCFLVIKNFLLFISLIIGIVGAILINYVVLEILYNFIVNKKWNKLRIFITTIISFILIGIGIGMFLVSVTEFDIVQKEVDVVKSSYEFEMRDDFVIERYYDDQIDFVYKDISNIQIVVEHSEMDSVNVYSAGKEIYIDMYSNESMLFKYVRQIIKDINNKELITYNTNISVIVYANKENIERLKENNMNRDFQIESYESEINEWKRRYDEISKRENICNENMYEIESYLNSEGYSIEYNKNGEVISFSNEED